MSEEITEEGVERTYQDMMKGLELGIKELQPGLCDQVDRLTQKELRRALKTLINLPQEAEITQRDPKSLNSKEIREANFLAKMITLNEMRVQLELNVIGEVLREQQEGEKHE